MITQINRIAVDHNIPTLLVLDNMKLETFIALMASYYCGIKVTNVHTVLTSPLYKDSVDDYLNKLKSSPLYIWEENFLSTDLLDTDSIIEIVKEHHIQIIFYDEVMNFSNYHDSQVGNILKRMALKLDVPVVATCTVGQSENFGYSAEISLSKFCSLGGFYGSDVIVSITDFEKLKIYTDEHGRNLRGKVQLKILKYKGTVKQKRGLFEREAMLMRKATMEMKKYDLLKQSLGNDINMKKLIEDLGLDIIGEDVKDDYSE